jgi:hypothetical protein
MGARPMLSTVTATAWLVLACARPDHRTTPPVSSEPEDAAAEDVASGKPADARGSTLPDAPASAPADAAADEAAPSPDLAVDRGGDRPGSDAGPPPIFHTRGFPLRALDVIAKSADPSERVLVSTLQGLVARTSAEQIYIDEGGPSTVWKQNLADRHGVTLDSSRTTWQALVEHFRAHVKGYVLYDRASPRSLTAATALAGPLDAIVVDVSLEEKVKALGLTVAVDVRARDEKWVYDQYPGRFSTRTAAELDPAISHQLRDYITLTRSFVHYDGLTPFRTRVMQALDREAFCFGYYGLDEFGMVSGASGQGVVMIPSDFAANLSVHSSVRDRELKQRPAPALTPETDVHYVTFVLSDGDNVAFDLWSMQTTYADPARGSFDMGYEISPALADLAPATMRWYYENASAGAHRDAFVAGPSGSGYMFPSKMPAADLGPYLDRLDAFMAAADLGIVSILDRGAVGRMDLWSAYLGRPHIDAVFYFDYDYNTKGEIAFTAPGKPVIASRDRLWGGITEEAELISRINARPKTPKSAAGYTMVQVHVWTKKLPNVLTVVKGLDPKVRVVAPDTFVKLVRMNLK